MASTLVVAPTNLSVQKSHKKDKFFYKVACILFLISVIILMTFLIVRAFRYKYNPNVEDKCHVVTWIDSAISIMTLIIIVTSAVIIVASLQYVFAKPIPIEEQIRVINPTEDFIRRNSQMPTVPVVVVKDPTIGSNNWLTAVRNEAYDNLRNQHQSSNNNKSNFLSP